jgi:2-polyprenyl-3-methyl-5-hydroxy-6-metoxy-1,4-benzoquinol methylase
MTPQSAPPTDYTEDYFRNWCRTHEQLVAAGVPSGYPRTIAYLQPQAGQWILDVGCGRGEIARTCARMGATAVGLDYSVAAVRIAKQDGTSSVVQADAARLPFPSCSFDKTAFVEILEHLDDAHLESALCEIRRVLKPGGCVVGSTPNRWGAVLPVLSRWASTLGLTVRTATRDDPFHINVKNPLSTRRVLRRAGFRVRMYVGQDYSFSETKIPHWRRLGARALFFLLHIWWVGEK